MIPSLSLFLLVTIKCNKKVLWKEQWSSTFVNI